MFILVVAFWRSLVATLLVVRSAKTFGVTAHDSDLTGPQKFHARPVPRIGGIGIVAGALAGALVLAWQDPHARASRRSYCSVAACRASWPA